MKEQGAKERILNTACELFYQQGYQATGINQIIEEAGIAKASLYQHFPSKEALLTEYLGRTRITNHTRRMEYIDQLAPGKDKLIGLFEFRRQHMEENNFRGCAFMRIAYELPGLNEDALLQVRTHSRTIKTLIAEQLGIIKPDLPENDLEEMTDMLFNLYEGAGLQGYIQKSAKPVEDTKKVVKKLLETL
ncbi:TetR/AcrR family transcriptional regulator [Chitinophaga arvensicola]|uniref:DNA-binding transcriptional regulator, AcrR family n=1 Tax=Chitinophaga arvensicola TaxID=29529 RepID=A0A1I0R5N9_9BACT|nr:TetR/AcrR family transcriptional regulator [Chitinophaga arvensicola]SEW35888.1 DNA-binding transcriptional regulator, AcrR family [Chitinophaga arvensicola]